ncbi:MAG: amino acid permease [Candidatus Altiarchaeota archaeon]|nr:amino acid permease [Candidatus Altiarchaeota archaeon]
MAARLSRELGLWEVALSGVGIILGAGIYALIGEAAGLAGNAVWMSFIVSAFVAVFTGLSYAELSSMYPKADAEYEYVKNGFGGKAAFVIGCLVALGGLIAASTVAVAFAGYLNALVEIEPLIASALLLTAASLILLAGIRQSASVAILFTLIEMAGLLIIIWIGLPHIGSVDYLDMPKGLSGVMHAAALIFFAFIGFEDIVKLSEETRRPEKNVPRGLLMAIAISILLYVSVAIAAVSAADWEELGKSKAPFADIAGSALGRDASTVLALIALFSTSNTVLLLLLSSSRMTYGMAGSGALPRMLSYVNERTRTPWNATLAVTLLSILFLYAGDLGALAGLTNYMVFLTFTFVNAAVLLLRYKNPEIKRPFRVPLNLGRAPLPAAFGLMTSLILLIALDTQAILTGTLLTLLVITASVKRTC